MTLFRTRDIILVLLMLAAAFATYEVKYAAQRRLSEARLLERKIVSEQDTAALLRARWALATDPARMERLAAQYRDELGLEIIGPRQIVKLSDVPEKLPDAIAAAIKDSEARPAGGPDNLDNIATASVKKPVSSAGARKAAASGAAKSGDKRS